VGKKRILRGPGKSKMGGNVLETQKGIKGRRNKRGVGRSPNVRKLNGETVELTVRGDGGKGKGNAAGSWRDVYLDQ